MVFAGGKKEGRRKGAGLPAARTNAGSRRETTGRRKCGVAGRKKSWLRGSAVQTRLLSGYKCSAGPRKKRGGVSNCNGEQSFVGTTIN